jgi:predicted dehydrogenase
MRAISLLFVVMFGVATVIAQGPLKVGVAGLKHDHVHGLMDNYKKGRVILLGIAEEDAQLVQRYKQAYHLPDSLFFGSLSSMLEHIHPDAVVAYDPVAEHLSVVEACAPRGISVMVEKPLATTDEQADRIAELADKYHIHVLTNYETTWYASNQQLYEMVHERGMIGKLRRMVARAGHQGPKEIGCSEDFLKWLTDPEKNGGGALVDFGCYGADLMTWLMDGRAPIAVTAITRHYKPDIYPRVDDDATILLEYPGATGLIEASWNWPYGIKDLEVFGQRGKLYAANGNSLEERVGDSVDRVALGPIPYTDNLGYLAAVLRGEIHPIKDPSSLEVNRVVVKILVAAGLSAKEGKRVMIKTVD